MENSKSAMFSAGAMMLAGLAVIVLTLLASLRDFSFLTIFGVFGGLGILLVGFLVSVRAWYQVASNVDSILQQLLDRQALRQGQQVAAAEELPAYGIGTARNSPAASRVVAHESRMD
ncbi:hypothetical protein [Buchananella hordeovulneris]|uniref:hypothetical protein n=1 Tax=Buchananella hordeovulneris TaxID=52770 RepID=UPI000F5DF499|nr:hypothetical protein [Buchananella hordeovulneris]MDO5080329.1 hypothetical protein [Buchananella hordeovulneris]RRD44882.1 hypothetical protein EII13_01590 [Buchananella hordeovulneris]